MRPLLMKPLLYLGVGLFVVGLWFCIASLALFMVGHIDDARWLGLAGGSLGGAGLCAGRLWWVLDK